MLGYIASAFVWAILLWTFVLILPGFEVFLGQLWFGRIILVILIVSVVLIGAYSKDHVMGMIYDDISRLKVFPEQDGEGPDYAGTLDAGGDV